MVQKAYAKTIEESLLDQRFVKIRYLVDPNDNELVGIVTKIDQQLRRLKVSHEQGADWISFSDILDVRIHVFP